jgi:hypothetical protein
MKTKVGSGNQLTIDSRSIIIGGTLFGLGVGACIAGIAVSGSAMLSAVHNWIAGLERPPAELARGTWTQAKAAATAAQQAWQDAQPATQQAPRPDMPRVPAAR